MMKFLIDNNLSPKLSNSLLSIGYQSKHVKEFKLEEASDEQIFNLAYRDKMTIITADTDFGYLLSKWEFEFPSVILFRYYSSNPIKQFEILKTILPKIEEDISKGSIIIIEPSRMRIKKLPY